MAHQILEFSSKFSHFPLPAQTFEVTDVKRVSTSSNDELLAKIDTLTHWLEVLELERRFSRFGRRLVRDHHGNQTPLVTVGTTPTSEIGLINAKKPCSFGSENESRRN